MGEIADLYDHTIDEEWDYPLPLWKRRRIARRYATQQRRELSRMRVRSFLAAPPRKPESLP